MLLRLPLVSDPDLKFVNNFGKLSSGFESFDLVEDISLDFDVDSESIFGILCFLSNLGCPKLAYTVGWVLTIGWALGFGIVLGTG